MNVIKQFINLFLILSLSVRIRSFELENIVDILNLETNLNIDTFNEFFTINFIDLSFFDQLNNYFFNFNNQDDLIYKQPLNVCLANKTEMCWSIDDTINIVKDKIYDNQCSNDRNSDFNNLNHNYSSSNETPFNLIKFKIHNLNLEYLNNYLNQLSDDEFKILLVCLNLVIQFVCSFFLFLLCIKNQYRHKTMELNQLLRRMECVSGLQQTKKDMKELASIVDELKLDAKQNLELKNKLQYLLTNELKQLNYQITNTNLKDNLKSIDGDHVNLSTNFSEQIDRLNQQLKLNQLEQSKLKYMICKTIESYDRILKKMYQKFQNT